MISFLVMDDFFYCQDVPRKFLIFLNTKMLITIFWFVFCCTVNNVYGKVNYGIVHTCMLGTFKIMLEASGQSNHYLAKRMPLPGQFINSSSWFCRCFKVPSILLYFNLWKRKTVSHHVSASFCPSVNLDVLFAIALVRPRRRHPRSP